MNAGWVLVGFLALLLLLMGWVMGALRREEMRQYRECGDVVHD